MFSISSPKIQPPDVLPKWTNVMFLLCFIITIQTICSTFHLVYFLFRRGCIPEQWLYVNMTQRWYIVH